MGCTDAIPLICKAAAAVLDAAKDPEGRCGRVAWEVSSVAACAPPQLSTVARKLLAAWKKRSHRVEASARSIFRATDAQALPAGGFAVRLQRADPAAAERALAWERRLAGAGRGASVKIKSKAERKPN